jgi:hypothetical protein
MTTPMTLEAFRATGQRVSIETACEALNEDASTFEGAQAIWLYAGLTYIEERSLAQGGAPMPAPFYVQIERDDYSGTKEQVEARLWFEWACSECTPAEAWTTADLTTLLSDWCAFTGMEPASAEELFLTACAKPMNERSYEELRRAYFLHWFLDLWDKVQAKEGIHVPEHDSELVTRSAPAWAWEVIDETLAMDAQSSAFDPDLREKIGKALEAMIDASEAGE